jgi:hypothetical protein
MYRNIVTGILLIINLTVFSQKKYVCEYSDTTTTILPDSIFAQILTSSRPDIEILPEVMQQFLSQMKVKPIFASQQRIVKAANGKL